MTDDPTLESVFRDPDELTGELPRFVELLRLSHGPVTQETTHCGGTLDVEEIEELPAALAGDPSAPVRAIYRCGRCERFFWGRWD
jgi:uncharacterized protein with PIN domain